MSNLLSHGFDRSREKKEQNNFMLLLHHPKNLRHKILVQAFALNKTFWPKRWSQTA
jgi:hypothetical protein